MAFGKVSLCSKVEGVILRDGAPVENVKVKRNFNWHWGNKKNSQTVLTDSDGRFRFSEETTSSLTAKLIPHEPVIEQKIVFTLDGVDYDGWFYTKHNYDNNGELNGKPLNFTCELSEEPQYRPTYGLHEAFGICRFD